MSEIPVTRENAFVGLKVQEKHPNWGIRCGLITQFSDTRAQCVVEWDKPDNLKETSNYFLPAKPPDVSCDLGLKIGIDPTIIYPSSVVPTRAKVIVIDPSKSTCLSKLNIKAGEVFTVEQDFNSSLLLYGYQEVFIKNAFALWDNTPLCNDGYILENLGGFDKVEVGEEVIITHPELDPDLAKRGIHKGATVIVIDNRGNLIRVKDCAGYFYKNAFSIRKKVSNNSNNINTINNANTGNPKSGAGRIIEVPGSTYEIRRAAEVRGCSVRAETGGAAIVSRSQRNPKIISFSS